MQAPNVDYVKLSRSGTENTAEIFSRSEIYHVFLSAEEEICGSPLLELETFSKLSCRKQGSLHATQKLKRHYEAIIFSLPQMVFYRPVDKI